MDPIITSTLPSPFLRSGLWINQNLAGLNIGVRVDETLPPGTIEVWQEGKRIGRVINIGQR